MTEITERDREMAQKVVQVVRAKCGPAEPHMMMIVTEPDLRAIALRVITEAREEGRQEQRQETARNAEQLMRSTSINAIKKARLQGRQEARERRDQEWRAWVTRVESAFQGSALDRATLLFLEGYPPPDRLQNRNTTPVEMQNVPRGEPET